MSNERILIIDDDQAVCLSLKLLLKKKGYETISVNHPSIAMETIAEFNPDLILLDMNFTINTTGKQGLAMLKRIVDDHPTVSVILMTGWATVQLAVEGMKIGAKDFLAKPWDNNHLVKSIQDILALTSTANPQRISSSSTQSEDQFAHIIGQTEPFMHAMDIAKRVAKTDASVLITGESGTGKEVISEAIHEMSQRSAQPFVKVNLGGISTTLFESEMFGHKKGAFTGAIADRTGRFELANKGSIFLDELGELPMDSQVKLLRVLQEKTFEPLGSSRSKRSDVRVISATNKDLLEMVAKGSFREDLFYRINLITIHLPSLRERKEDIPLLVKHFVKSTCQAYNFDQPILEDTTMNWLKNQAYPGNIRQLKNMVERTILLNTNSKILNVKDFQSYTKINPASTHVSLPEVGKITLQEMEINMIKKALAYHHHSISKTAASLGITRSALYRRLEKHNIPHESQI
ncbi:MAG: sigma-54 dependent transcriptional regulator [Saprospiraceae bacterium]|nr:sigma-54 dependent transcriptional regulator [Saprospiraceae bacterium]